MFALCVTVVFCEYDDRDRLFAAACTCSCYRKRLPINLPYCPCVIPPTPTCEKNSLYGNRIIESSQFRNRSQQKANAKHN